jgi:hypothetical protein
MPAGDLLILAGHPLIFVPNGDVCLETDSDVNCLSEITVGE